MALVKPTSQIPRRRPPERGEEWALAVKRLCCLWWPSVLSYRRMFLVVPKALVGPEGPSCFVVRGLLCSDLFKYQDFAAGGFLVGDQEPDMI